MFRTIIFCVTLLGSFLASAEPELAGTPSQLKHFLRDIPKIVTFSASAEEALSLNKAVVRLSVATESKKLSEALEENLNIRRMVRSRLEKSGIAQDKINESKFSSTPEFGFFDERPKSYKVENSLAIEVENETQMIAVALVADEIEQVHYLGSEAELADKPSSKQQLLDVAIQRAQEKAELFKSKLGVQLKVVEFKEFASELPTPTDKNYRGRKVESFYSSAGDVATQFGQSTYSVTVSISYEVLR